MQEPSGLRRYCPSYKECARLVQLLKKGVGSNANIALMGIQADLYQASVSFSNSEMSLRSLSIRGVGLVENDDFDSIDVFDSDELTRSLMSVRCMVSFKV